ncbi:MAG TPA: DUF6491 family protein [Rhodanobacteraceae bacterium]|nr:DUF6491 family protein [Rhodanobacteraceae bacterium]
MPNAISKWAGLAMLLAGIVALPAWTQQTASERADLARYQKYAQAPVDHVRYFDIDGFQYLAPDKLAIWFGVNKLYLLTVQTPCNNLAFTNGIGLTSKNNMLYARFDFVTFGHQRCKILTIEPVNELQMKQDAEAARSTKAARPASSG